MFKKCANHWCECLTMEALLYSVMAPQNCLKTKGVWALKFFTTPVSSFQLFYINKILPKDIMIISTLKN